ncbi:hypothetical protein BDW72DRAFT_56624 [Aspergillus terricola var. indicus]
MSNLLTSLIIGVIADPIQSEDSTFALMETLPSRRQIPLLYSPDMLLIRRYKASFDRVLSATSGLNGVYSLLRPASMQEVFIDSGRISELPLDPGLPLDILYCAWPSICIILPFLFLEHLQSETSYRMASVALRSTFVIWMMHEIHIMHSALCYGGNLAFILQFGMCRPR